MLDNAKLVAGLEAEYLSLMAKRASLPVVGSYSLDGLSVSTAGAWESIQKRMDAIAQELAGYGHPIGTRFVPFQTAEVMRG